MSKITNMTHLREHALTTLEKLANHEIDTSEAAVTGKLVDSIIGTITSQMAYARMIEEKPFIPFVDADPSASIMLEGKKEEEVMKLPHFGKNR